MQVLFKVLCQKHGCSFIDNSNASSENLPQDGLHLNNSGKGVLQDNHVVTLNDGYFLGPSFTQQILTTFLKLNVVNLKKLLVWIGKMIMFWIIKQKCLKRVL